MMKTRTGLPRLPVALLCLVMICICAVPALAKDAINTDRIDCSLELTYEYNGVKLSGVDVRLYKVATVTADRVFTLTDNFADCGAAVDHTTSEGWNAVTLVIAGYATANGVTPTAIGSSESDGVYKFSDLETGLYLFVSDPVTKDGKTYSFKSSLISIPDLDVRKDVYIYNVEASPKIEVRDAPGKDDIVIVTAVKTWDDTGYENQRPQNVTMQLYHNGELYPQNGEQALSSANGWRYTWTAKDDGGTWEIYEKPVGAKYTVTIAVTKTENGTETTAYEYKVTNTYKPTTTPPDKPPLPQTGQLWWQVIALTCTGLALFTGGWLLARRKQRGDGEEK